MFDLEPLSWLILVFVGIFIIVLIYALFSATAKRATGEKIHETDRRGAPGACPVCGSILKNGAQLKSALYPGEQDRLCYIYGCPHCYPRCKVNLSRQCPVCNKELGQEDHLVARYFERRNAPKRVHIVGCPSCRKM